MYNSNLESTPTHQAADFSFQFQWIVVADLDILKIQQLGQAAGAEIKAEQDSMPCEHLCVTLEHLLLSSAPLLPL